MPRGRGGSNQAIHQAIRHYNGRHYQDSVVRCRFAVEEALLGEGVASDPLTNTIKNTRKQHIITSRVTGAPPQNDELPNATKASSLMGIGVTVKIVRSLYLSGHTSP